MSGVKLKKIIKKYDQLQVIHGVDLEIAAGEFCVFVGPSGCGKSTLLRMIAGLEDTTDGQMFIGDTDVTRMDPAERGISMVFQTYALYPHMSVEENMGFGLKMNKVDKAEIKQKVAQASRILQLDDYLKRKPKALSGGQRQRVAIGRAIVRGPQVFLFDEPLSNLDAELRVDMRVEIARLHNELDATMIYVTHDQVEAMTLADKIVVLRDGKIEQVGSPLALYDDPDNKFVAGFIGSPSMNFLQGVVADGKVQIAAFAGQSVTTDVALPEEGRQVLVGVRPQALSLNKGQRDLKVDITEELGGVAYVYLTASNGERVVVEARGKSDVLKGTQVGVEFDAEQLMFFDSQTEQRLRSLAF